jgi:hypothetical protein
VASFSRKASCSPKERRKQKSAHVAFDTHPVGRGGGHGERRPLRLGRPTKSPQWWCSVEVLLRISTRWGSPFFNALLVGAMVATLAIAALYALRRDIWGVLGTLSSVAAFVGVALTLLGELGSPVAAVVGLLVESVGVLALGVVSMAVGELAWWCAVALIVWGWALVFLLLLPMMGVLAPPFPVSWGGVLAGLSWIVVGFGVFRAARGRTEQPQREH